MVLGSILSQRETVPLYLGLYLHKSKDMCPQRAHISYVMYDEVIIARMTSIDP